MSLAGAAVQNKTTTLVLTVVLAVAGVMAFDTLSRLEDPEFTIKDAKVITPYPGASAREVADEVTDLIETALQKMGQVKEVTSKSTPGLSIVTVTMKDEFGADLLPQVWDEVRRKVGDVQGQLPPGAGPTLVNDDFGDVFGIYFAVYGDGYSYRELKDHVDLLERELLLVPDVAKVEIFADQDEIIAIEMSRARMAQLGISETQIYRTLEARNTVAPSGQVGVGSEYIRIVPTPGIDSVEDIGNTLIRGIASDRQVFLRDIAEIRREYRDPPQRIIRYNGRPAIGVGISTAAGGNVVTMGEAVERRLRELEGETPIGIEVGSIYWQSRYVTKAINGFVVSLLQALAIVIGVLLFAMGARSGILIGIILLLTVLGTFVPMKGQDIALERISLGALIIALGMLVDNAIVVVEGIQLRIESGMDRIKAAAEVVRSTMWPLLGGTFVAILAFGALGFSTDNTGEFCRSLFQVITISLLLSWLLAVTVTPLLSVMMLKGKKEGDEERDPYGGPVFRGYRGLLRALIGHRWLTLGAMVVLLLATVRGFGAVEQSFFPDSTTPQFTVDFWTTQGTHIRETEERIEAVEAYVMGLDGVENVAATVGGGSLRFLLTYAPEEPNSAYGQLIVEVDDFRRIPEVIPLIEAYVEATFPDAMTYARPFVLGPGGGSKVEVRLRGPDPVVLRRLSEAIKDVMRADPGARDVRDDWRESVKIVRPVVAERPAARAGLTRRDLSAAIQRTYGGNAVGLYREGDKLIPILARAPAVERDDVESLYDLQVWSPVAGGGFPCARWSATSRPSGRTRSSRARTACRRSRRSATRCRGTPASCSSVCAPRSRPSSGSGSRNGICRPPTPWSGAASTRTRRTHRPAWRRRSR
ncbi:MAG: efflux RND transporter permease subunit [Planctomycetota bacterium]|jgi:multidrug efflux pump subunit AcrB